MSSNTIEPSPQTWTLRLKARKTTVLLHVDPLHTFTAIKIQLYDVLKETDIRDSKTKGNLSLPESPEDIQFGRPIDINDPQQGFQPGEWELPAYESEEDNVKSKGKAKANNKARSGIADCPKGAGLKDGAVLAFRWAGDGVWEGGEDEVLEHESKMWGVELASFADAYGVENQTDVGGGREFEG